MTQTRRNKNNAQRAQKMACALMQKHYPDLTVGSPLDDPTCFDIVPRAMGMPGEDILLSPKARKQIPFTQEVKHTKAMATLEKWYKQSQKNAPKTNDVVPLVVVHKHGTSRLMAVLDYEDLMKLTKRENKL